MRIMIETTGSIATGLTSVFAAVGHEVYNWQPGIPVFDAFDEFSPEIFIGMDTKWSWARSVHRCLEEWKASTLSNIDSQVYPAADTFRFHQGKHKANLACDASCLITKNVTPKKFDELVTPLIQAGHNIKVVGEPIFRIPQYLGKIEDETLCDLYASSRVCLALDKSYAVFDAFLSGTIPISLYDDAPCELEDVDFCACEHPDQFHHWFRSLITTSAQKSRKDFIKIGRETIAKEGTYWHHAARLFNHFDMKHEHDRIMEAYHATIKL